MDSHRAKLHKLGHPLRIFGKGAFFQPYIPLQQIDVLESRNTKVFLTGTSNSIFTHHKSCAIDVVAHADTGVLEITNPSINNLISLTSADKKFIDGKFVCYLDIIKPIVNSWKPEGSFLFTKMICHNMIKLILKVVMMIYEHDLSSILRNYLQVLNMMKINLWLKVTYI